MDTDAERGDVGLGQADLVDLEELCRLAAREMIAVALDAARRAYLEVHADVRDAAGKASGGG